jgi:3D (Asp-Asp-Asp) domain-containing protein
MDKKIIIINIIFTIILIPSSSVNASLLNQFYKKQDFFNNKYLVIPNLSVRKNLENLIEKKNISSEIETFEVKEEEIEEIKEKQSNNINYPAEPLNKYSSAPAKKVFIVTATAYSSTPDQTDDTPFITASNTIVRDGVVAANFLPIGTEIRIPELFGNKIFVVEDRMHKRYWYRIDIWFPEKEMALQFGIKKVLIEIVS